MKCSYCLAVNPIWKSLTLPAPDNEPAILQCECGKVTTVYQEDQCPEEETNHTFTLQVTLTEQDMEVLQAHAESIDLTPESALAYFLMGTLCDRKQIVTNVIGRKDK